MLRENSINLTLFLSLAWWRFLTTALLTLATTAALLAFAFAFASASTLLPLATASSTLLATLTTANTWAVAFGFWALLEMLIVVDDVDLFAFVRGFFVGQSGCARARAGA